MGGPFKERQWGETIRHAEQRAKETRFVADVAACDAWNYRMEGYGGPAQPSPPIGDGVSRTRTASSEPAGISSGRFDWTLIRHPGLAR